MEKLSVRRREAAQMLSISESWLEKLTAAGEIPCVKHGRAVLYNVADLRAWLARHTQQQEPESKE